MSSISHRSFWYVSFGSALAVHFKKLPQPTMMAIMKKTENNDYWQRCEETGTLIHAASL